MRINRLSILGFKSIMDRVEIKFPHGISGIVGPNGCGKSNIVDAIRWCMGEQSPKQLRGRQMEDLIFSGTGDYKPMGMAEVSLAFANGDGSFPEAYANETELTVTRRLYRSGESEYLINSMPCRLKDIAEIFMDTGLGNRAYSIIGQGQIGTILEQKPEETRVMLEEAAGITKYRKKVEASRKKIELTEANLQRVEDIMGEIERQVRSLKRQASKARRYKQLSEKIKELELIMHANNYNQLKEKSGEKLKSTEELVQREFTQQTELSKHQTDVEGMNLKLDEMDSSLSGLRKAHFRLNEKANRKSSELEGLQREMGMQEELERKLVQQEEDLKRKLVELRSEREKIKKEIDAKDKACDELEGEIELKKNLLKGRREYLNSAKDEYEKARAELAEGSNKEIGLDHKSGYLRKMIDQISDNRSRLENDLDEIEEKTEKILAASEKKVQARDSTNQRLSDIERSTEDHKLKLEKYEDKKNSLEAELKAREKELNLSQSRLSSLKALTESFEGYKVGVRTIMKAQDFQPKQEGRILGVLADLIQVEPEYEPAVEAALTDRLQYVIVETKEDGEKAVGYLKNKEKGRGSFAPLDELNLPVKSSENCKLPFLCDYVSIDEPLRRLVENILGKTVLVKSLHEAFELRNGDENGFSYVTMEGDFVDQHGIITGGRLSRSSQGILARKREIVQLKETCAGLEKGVAKLAGEMEETVSRLRNSKKLLEDLTDKRWECQGEINELDKIVFRLSQELDQLERQSENITHDLKTKDTEKNRHREELKRVEEELQMCRTRRKEESEYFQKKEAELRECEEEFDKFREEINRLEGDSRVLKEEQRGLKRELERIQDYGNESKNRLEKIGDDILTARRRGEECGEEVEILKEAISFLYDEVNGAQESVSQAERERHSFQDLIREQEDRTGLCRSELNETKEKINMARMESSEIQYRMNTLKDTVSERFNMDLASCYEEYLDENFSAGEMEKQIIQDKDARQKLGEVNLTAIKEHEALTERYEFITKQREDLVGSIDSLRVAINKINKTSLERFNETFTAVDSKLKEIFPILFNGGTAGLELTDESRPLESGVLVTVQPPGKKLGHMGLLSGGEKALVAMALLFAIYMIKPSPFCLLDEVDAPLDEANVDRFNNLLKRIKGSSQIIMVTHNRRTMEIADRLYGMTMEKAGVSKTVSVDLQVIKEKLSTGDKAEQITVH